MKASTYFHLKKLHSLTGLVPIGAFLLEHTFTNAFAVRGAATYNEKVAFLQSLPMVVALEIGFIALPILFHAILGVVIVRHARFNTQAYGWGRNWMFLLQRATGIYLIPYIALHVYWTRFSGSEDFFALMANHLANPALFVFYVLGVLAAAFHLGNGLWGFLVAWGVTTGARAMRVAGWACTAVAVLLGYVGVNSLLGFLGTPIPLFWHGLGG